MNPKEPGQMCFVTSTCLDYAHLFKGEEMRTRMAISLLRDCRRADALLKAFVVMTHHIHLVVKPRENQSISRLVQTIKANSEGRLLPLLTEEENAQLSMQCGLNKHRFWMRSFRANPMHTQEVFEQKLRYIHLNPVRSGLCEIPEDYPWSSAHLVINGHLDFDGLVDYSAGLRYYEEVLGY